MSHSPENRFQTLYPIRDKESKEPGAIIGMSKESPHQIDGDPSSDEILTSQDTPSREVAPNSHDALRSPIMSRREALKKLGGGALGLAGSTSTIGVAQKILAHTRASQDLPLEAVSDQTVQQQETEQPQEVAELDNKPLSPDEAIEKIMEEFGIDIRNDFLRANIARHYKDYSPKEVDYTGVDNHKGLRKAMEKMRPWLNPMKEAFAKQNVPDEYVYLTIPESHFMLDKKRSTAGAVGYYQFLEETATNQVVNMNVTDSYDERLDPIKSAEGCAKYLRHLYDSSCNGDWKLALLRYNGSLIDEYFKKTPLENRTSAEAFQFLKKEADEALTQAIHKNIPVHTVQSGDTLSGIADAHNISVDDLMDVNTITDPKNIRPDQKILLATKSDPRIENLKKKVLAKYNENLDYPPKLIAILAAIKNYHLSDSVSQRDPEYKEMIIEAQGKRKYNYTVQGPQYDNEGNRTRGRDTIRMIAKQLEGVHTKNTSAFVPWAEIQRIILEENDISDERTIQIGQVLTFRLAVGPTPTAKDIFQKEDLPITDEVKHLNQAIVNYNAPLPYGATVRIPEDPILYANAN